MSTNRHLIGRRQFLIASSACTVATAIAGPQLFAREAGASPSRVTVGFASFDEPATVMAAAAITAGDGAFIGRGAQISVSGASGTAANPVQRRAVELVAHYAYFDGAERKVAPFRAWGCSRATGCQGSPVRFTVPVDEIQKLVFTVETERGRVVSSATRREALSLSTAEVESFPVTLSVGSGDDSLKLARGYYVVVPMFAGDGDPSWSSYTVAAVDGRFALVDAAGTVAPFEHFVLRVDYAKL